MSDAETTPEPDRIDNVPHPRVTERLLGQEQAAAAFLDAYNQGRLHHAWLITGPKGIGKATLAWNIARFLLAQDADADALFSAPPDSLHIGPDNPVFHRVAALSEPGLFLCRRGWDEKKKKLKTVITVDEVRKLKAFFALSATEGGWRIAIVDAVDEMNPSAENALLKILEEPPAKTLILLASHQPAKLLPTIRSRCRELRCQPLPPDTLQQVMQQAGLDTDTDFAALTELSGGSAAEAINLLANDGLALYHDILSLLATAPRMNRPRITALADSCGGGTAKARYDMVVHLLTLALSRLALAGAKGGSGDIAAEASLAARLSANARQAQIWAVLVQEITARIDHARAVNLDPAMVILDTFIKIDSAAGRASLLSSQGR